jgi:hypothetical protein
MAKTATKSGNEPVFKKKRKGIHMALFENVSDNGTFFKATFQRVYKKDDKFETTNSFSRDDLPCLAMLANDAYAWILEAESNRNKEE